MGNFKRVLSIGFAVSVGLMVARPGVSLAGASWRVSAVVLGRSAGAIVTNGSSSRVLAVGDSFDGSRVVRISEDGVQLSDGREVDVSADPSTQTSESLSKASPGASRPQSAPVAPVIVILNTGAATGVNPYGNSGYGYGGGLGFGGYNFGYGRPRAPYVTGPPSGQSMVPPPLGLVPALPQSRVVRNR